MKEKTIPKLRSAKLEEQGLQRFAREAYALTGLGIPMALLSHDLCLKPALPPQLRQNRTCNTRVSSRRVVALAKRDGDHR